LSARFPSDPNINPRDKRAPEVKSAREVAQARADRLHRRQPDGPRRELGPMAYGRVVHFAHADVLGERRIVHAKVATWGKRGARVLDRDGNEYRVPYEHMAPGLHDSVAPRDGIAKSDYERRDPRTGKIEHVHDSRVRHVVTEHHPNGTYHFGVQKEPGGHRIMMRIAHKDGGASEWESAMIGGLHGSADEAMKRLAGKMAQAHLQGSQVEHHHEEVKRHFEAALQEHSRRQEADRKAKESEAARQQQEAERRAQIDLEFMAAKFKKTRFTMHITDGEPQEVEGWGIGGLVVHKVGEGKYAKCTVSHIASGKSLGLQYVTQGEARLAAHRLSKEADWTKPAEEVVKDRSLAGKIGALRISPEGKFA
jgi:hypothetical protein